MIRIKIYTALDSNKTSKQLTYIFTLVGYVTKQITQKLYAFNGELKQCMDDVFDQIKNINFQNVFLR